MGSTNIKYDFPPNWFILNKYTYLPMVVVDDDQDFSEIIEDRGPESWTAR